MQITAGYWDNRWFGYIFGKQKCPALQCFEKEYGAQKTALAKSDVQVKVVSERQAKLLRERLPGL